MGVEKKMPRDLLYPEYRKYHCRSLFRNIR